MSSAPALGDLDAFICARARLSSNKRSINISIFPPDAFFPYIRAGITFVLLKISKSP